MWIDEAGAVHTVWVPPQDILGEEAIAALRAVPPQDRAAALAELDGRFDDVVSAVTPEAPRGPIDLGDSESRQADEHLADPPLMEGLVPRSDESLASTVLAWLDQVPPRWRLEALEAVAEVLDEVDENGS